MINEEYLLLRNVFNIISASLSIKAEQSANAIDLPSVTCLSAHRYCGKSADWIRMQFGVVSGVRLGMGVLDFGGDRRRGTGSLGVNLRSSQITLRTYFELLLQLAAITSRIHTSAMIDEYEITVNNLLLFGIALSGYIHSYAHYLSTLDSE